MSVAEDTDVRPGSVEKGPSVLGHFSALIQDVPNGDSKPCKLDHRFRWKSAFIVSVDVAGDCRHGSDFLKLRDDGSLADITRVNNMIDIFEVA